MAKNTEKLESIIRMAVEAGRLAADRTPKDAYKATERRLYALPVIREKLENDRERLKETLEYGPRERSKSITRFMKTGVRLSREEIFDAVVLDMEAEIAQDEHEIETVERVLSSISGDEYYRTVTGRYIENLTDDQIAEQIPCDTSTVWRNRKRLVRKAAILLYGAKAI